MKINKIKNQFGVTAIEYALLMFLISVGILLSVQTAGYKLSDTFCSVSFALGGKSCAGTTNPADLSFADKLQSSLTDKLDKNYIDSSQGGTGGHWNPDAWGPDDQVTVSTASLDMQNIANGLENLNAEDPITNVFGIYDRSGKVVNDYATALAGFQSGSNWLNYYNSTISSMTLPDGVTLPNGSGLIDGVEVTTQSGKVYHIDQTGEATEQPSK
ncbi:Flp family type IVb pilin [Acetobacter okinawensis]|uniref:Flp family type IVb pilin n=1 Tax=Acetobacter okinawensis TaxID=1076594 RepID=UPI001BACFC25|nr:Flp family type IVb pilin [Acetobacter okinawensis]MBS0987341.1 Flp family type IVb pilin [Acetobacter okinawensis]